MIYFNVNFVQNKNMQKFHLQQKPLRSSTRIYDVYMLASEGWENGGKLSIFTRAFCLPHNYCNKKVCHLKFLQFFFYMF